MSIVQGGRATGAMFAAAFLTPWLFIWQGLDFTDQGYLLTGYRCFFKHPEVAEDSASLWLTNLVGASWDAAFGRWGVLGMRALWALCLSLTLLLAFRAIRRVAAERTAAASVLVASIFLSDRRETWFSYNTSTTVLMVAAVACLVPSVLHRRRWWLFGTGVVLGCLPFARLPNLLALGLVITPLLCAVADPSRRRGALKETSTLVAGALAGILGVLALIVAMGHAKLVESGVRGLFEPGAEQSGYGTQTLLSSFIRDETTALAWGLGGCLAGLGLARALGRIPTRAGWAVLLPLALLGTLGLAGTDELWRFVVPGTCYWLLGAVALGFWQPSFEQRLLAFGALVVLVIAPLGSNNGIRNAHVGLWLALPVGLGLLASLNVKYLATQGPKLALLAGLVLLGEGVHRAATYTYRDGPRNTLRSSIPHRQLRGQLTTPTRAKSVTEVLEALKGRVAPGDYLLASEGTPLLQYLTRTRPYLNRPWVMGAVTGGEIRRLAAEAPKRTGCLPVAVLTFSSARRPQWPDGPRRLESRQPQAGTRAAIKAFLRKHRYRRTWENGYFEIQEPPERKGCR